MKTIKNNKKIFYKLILSKKIDKNHGMYTYKYFEKILLDNDVSNFLKKNT
ncbi:MAG: hypothetical protein IR527_00475 [Bacteroides sp.]|nr:MAG: hypothetical protein IR527_00475 [Bacteroides sp.]